MRLSIITINLNNRDGLKRTIESIICQTFKDFEWIIVDGGSTDGSRKLMEQYVGYFSYWVSEPDKGIYNAMNKGIRQAQGEYCLFLNSGDYLVDSDILEKVFALDFNEDVVYGYSLNEKKGKIEIKYSPRDLTLLFFYKNTIHHSGNAFIKRDAFNSWGLYDESFRIASDYKWFLQALGMGDATTRFVNMNLSVFDCSGISETNRDLLMKEREQIFNDVVPFRVRRDYEVINQIQEENYALQRTLLSGRRLSKVTYAVLFKAIIYKVLHRR